MRGARQIRPVQIPLKNLVNAEGSPETVTAGLAILGGDDYGAILEYATAYAVARKCKPESGNETYDYGKAVATVALACVDPESDPSNPAPFFGASDHPTLEERAADVLSNRLIGRDTILYLAECQDVWQDECSPQPGMGEKTPEEFFEIMGRIVAEGPLAFLRLSAGSRLKCTHFMANLLVTSQTLKSESGSNSES
jgi:hypothetical protein